MLTTKVQDITLLEIDHPGANDPQYRLRRDFIASQFQKFLKTGIITDIEYTNQENQTWQTVLTKLEPLHNEYACSHFLNAQSKLTISKSKIPSFNKINQELDTQTGFRLQPIAGLIDGGSFMSLLGNKTMPCTQYIRHHSKPDYTPEPDIIHEVIGHGFLFTDPEIVEITVLFGKLAKRMISSKNEKGLILLGKIYWFSIEFGLIEENKKVKVLGAGLLSSIGEMKNASTGNVTRIPFDIETINNINYDFSKLQDTYMILPSLSFLKQILVENF